MTLTATSPFATCELPLTAGALSLAEYPIERMWSVAADTAPTAEAIRADHAHWFVFGDRPEGRVTDQSDGWAALDLTGSGWEEVLARLCPLDPAAIAPGSAQRSEVGHLMALVVGIEGGVRIFVMRSFARHLHHEVAIAMRSVAAQAAL